MKKDSVQTTVRLPVALFSRLNELIPNGKRRDFIRKAIVEKLARDFRETVSPVLTRGEQGRRTDLERRRQELEKQLAPYGGAAEILKTGEGYEETAETLKELSRVEKDIIATCDRARRIWERAEKQREAARAATRKLQETLARERKEDEAREQAAGDFPESGTEQEKLEWYSRAGKPLDLEKIKERARLEKDVKEKRLEVNRLYREAWEAAGIVPRKHAKSDEGKASDGNA